MFYAEEGIIVRELELEEGLVGFVQGVCVEFVHFLEQGLKGGGIDGSFLEN